MGLFKTLTTFLAPRKAEFTKRLVSERRAMAQEKLIAGVAVQGSAEFRLRMFGLESAEYAIVPEATLVNILEQYWQPHIANFYTNLSLFGRPYEPERGASRDEAAALAKRRVNDLAGHIEYKLTGNPQAAVHLPEFSSFSEYIHYRIKIEHPTNPYVGPQFGFTDDFFQYALNESRHVFNRQLWLVQR